MGGHSNVGLKKDVEFYKMYLDDLEAAVREAMGIAKFLNSEEIATCVDHASMMIPWLDQIGKLTADKMRPKYGKFYAFEKTVSVNSTPVVLSMVSYR